MENENTKDIEKDNRKHEDRWTRESRCKHYYDFQRYDFRQKETCYRCIHCGRYLYC